MKGALGELKKWALMILSLVLILGCAASASADKLAEIKEKGVLVVGAEVGFPPYEFYYTDPATGTEALAGFEMSMAQGLADELGVQLQVADQAFSGLITALRAGEIDMIISGLSIKPDRQEVVDFSDPYYTGKQVVLVRSEDLDMYKAPSDFDGKNLGAQTGSLQQGVAEEQFPKANLVLLDKVPLLVMELDQGTIDGLVITDNVAQSYFGKYPNLVMSDVPVVFESAGVAAAVQKGDNATLLKAVNDYIAAVKADGRFQQWFDTAIKQNQELVAAEAG
jgi:polar amino acid transport system substrate-binding protein